MLEVIDVYGVLTCDLAGSRSLTQNARQASTTTIRAAVQCLRHTFPCVLGEGFEFRFGDEWQVLLDRPDLCYTVYSHLHYHLREYPFYCGIGIGPLVTGPSANTHEADGPAFHLARAALTKAKQARSRICFRFPQEQKVVEGVAQSVADLLATLRGGRRPTQEEVCKLGVLSGLSVAEIAVELTLERTAASHRARSAGLREELTAMQALERSLRCSFNSPDANVS
ncbi:MAG: hypothetical protein K0R39_3568 [Symbiobacteriaceae bacterium]|jgi:hypothetical protein|nr:hypothetical protein [Symbiobacteriaceae bacterium]